MISNYKIIRQKTLFDDETSDDKCFREEIKKKRKKEIKEKEKAYMERYAKSCQVNLSEVDKIIERNNEFYEEMLKGVFGSSISNDEKPYRDMLEEWFKDYVSDNTEYDF